MARGRMRSRLIRVRRLWSGGGPECLLSDSELKAVSVFLSVNEWTASPHALPVDRTQHRQAGRLTNSQAKCVGGGQRIVPGRFENRSWPVTCTCSRSAPLHASPPPVMATGCDRLRPVWTSGRLVDTRKRGTLTHGSVWRAQDQGLAPQPSQRNEPVRPRQRHQRPGQQRRARLGSPWRAKIVRPSGGVIAVA